MADITIPKRVFIVPYRNRIQHKFFFSKYMSYILEDETDYEIYFSHQCDARTFNRGATKNIGFLAIKQKYPEYYKDITFIFNDIDTIPFNKIFDYNTTPGIVKHYYGFKYALGGIVVMKGCDFEKINGFPCFWGWGMEDNVLQKRCDKFGLKIDRSVFYNIGSPEILQLFDGISRIISKKDPWRMEHDNGHDGLSSIHKLQFTIDTKSANENDNIFSVHNERIYYVNISTFLTYTRFENDQYYNYDLREPKRKIIHPDRLRETKQTVVTTDNWSNIPYYPTTRERKENIVKHLIASNKPVPQELLKQIEQDKMREIQNDAFNKEIDTNNNNLHLEKEKISPEEEIRQFQHHPPQPSQQFLQHQLQQHQIQQMQQQQISYQRQYQQVQKPVQVPHKYSREYAQYIGQQARAQASAKIKLGGIY
jgi:hypothetical protein